ncbi:hypothetical protein VBD025_15200 [Virgibacillus flavescens]|uniref:hypothetical protein n=1 Tax=Virgibacillus flavescens TaxID=1611422 RepID=UPI003D340E06
MKRIKDERLQIQSLKNIRIAFILQTLGIIVILLYEMITEGVLEATNNPLWFVFLITTVALSWLNLKISVDVYENATEKKMPGPYYRAVILSALIGITLALLAKFGPDKSSNSDALIVGGVVFICFLMPYTFVYYVRKKRLDDNDS